MCLRMTRNGFVCPTHLLLPCIPWRCAHGACMYMCCPVPLHRAGRLYTGLRGVVTAFWCAHCVRLAATPFNAAWFVAVRCVFAVPASSTWLDILAHILDKSHQRGLNAMQVALHHQKKGAAYELRQWYGTLCCPIPYHAGGWRSQLVGVCQVPPRTVSAGATRDRLRHAG